MGEGHARATRVYLGASVCVRDIQTFVGWAWEGLRQGTSGQGVGLATKDMRGLLWVSLRGWSKCAWVIICARATLRACGRQMSEGWTTIWHARATSSE